MASKTTRRKFEKEREAHYALERVKEAERAQARLKGFRPATMGEMTAAILGTTHAESAREGRPPQNRRQRRAR